MTTNEELTPEFYAREKARVLKAYPDAHILEDIGYDQEYFLDDEKTPRIGHMFFLISQGEVIATSFDSDYVWVEVFEDADMELISARETVTELEKKQELSYAD